MSFPANVIPVLSGPVSSVPALLCENGFYLVQENGFFILLE